jgi:Bacterial regulatory proteins, tetR family
MFNQNMLCFCIDDFKLSRNSNNYASIAHNTHGKTGVRMGAKTIRDTRREEITSAARDLFSRKDFHGTTMPDIARAAGISTGLIYYIFPSANPLDLFGFPRYHSYCTRGRGAGQPELLFFGPFEETALVRKIFCWPVVKKSLPCISTSLTRLATSPIRSNALILLCANSIPRWTKDQNA